MSASRPVDVAGLVAAALMSASASVWICWRNFDAVLLGTIAVHMFEMAIVQVVGMPLVAHSSVAATRAVAVRLMRVFLCGDVMFRSPLQFACGGAGRLWTPRKRLWIG